MVNMILGVHGKVVTNLFAWIACRIKACIMDEPSQHETSCFDKIGIGIVG